MGKIALSSRLIGLLVTASAFAAPALGEPARLGPLVEHRAQLKAGTSRVIVTAADDLSQPQLLDTIKKLGGKLHRTLRLAGAVTAELPNAAIAKLAADPHVGRIALDRPIVATMERTGATIGSTAVRQSLGIDGSGVGVAIIDSGVTSWHDDLSGVGVTQRVDAFVDFVNGRDTPYDDFGHGTHVAGIVAGNGFDSSGARAGVAPGAHLVALKVLDAAGAGHISDVIAALDWVVEHRDTFNIRVVNLSVATGVFESYQTDPLTVAAKRAVDAGVVVVAAAGNFGHDPNGRTTYGGITAPGNAPWVLTVGASSHMGTIDRSDDTMASFSSHGPTAIDGSAKPDLVAPGVGVESLSDPTSTIYTSQAAYLLPGTVQTAYLPYLAQSGTSMSAPVVAGTVALMYQANPALTPNAVKAILQYTAQIYPAYDPLTEGAGFLNALGAVTLARYFANEDGPYPSSPDWSGRVIWGNRLISGGRLTPDANAWTIGVTWGSLSTPTDERVEWGEICTTGNCNSGAWSSWRVNCKDLRCNRGAWSTGSSSNIVWGTRCGGADCSDAWLLSLFSTSDTGDTVVWGTSGDGDTVVWGTTGDGDTVVWGTNGDGDTVVWGTTCSGPTCASVVWRP